MAPSRKNNHNVGQTKAVEKPLSKKRNITLASNEDVTQVPTVKGKCVGNNRQQSNVLGKHPRDDVNNTESDLSSGKDKTFLPFGELNIDAMDEKDDSIIDGEDIFDTQSSQDNLLEMSQDGDMQCDVKWDYRSPETTKQLKKMRGKYSVQDVKRIIANFPDMPIKPVSSFDRIKLSIQPKRFDVCAEKSRVTRATKQRAAKRWQQREKCRGAVEDMLMFLQEQQQQENTEAEDRPAEKKKESFSAEIHHDKPGVQDSWSDDDLFEDNSFLIQATQNLEKLLPVVNETHEKQQNDVNMRRWNAQSDLSSRSSGSFLSSSSSSSFMHSVVDSSSVIPSSYAGNSHKQNCGSKFVKGFSKPVNVNNVKTAGNIFKPPVKSKPSTVDTFSSVSNSKFSHGVHANLANNQHSHMVGNNTCKTSTVTTKQLLRQTTAKTSSPSPSLNSPFRRALSFDSSFSKSDIDSNLKRLPGNKHIEKASSQNLSFNSSFTDEMLLKATEDLDVVWASTSSYHKSSVNESVFNKSCLNQDLKAASSLSKDANITSTLLSPVRPTMETHAKRLEQKPASSCVQRFLKKSFALDSHQGLKHKSEAELHASTPVKVLKTADHKDSLLGKAATSASNTSCSDSFLEDDSFMNDEALFESQILPMLELAETQAVPKKAVSPVKYSPDEIEKKRQAALEKLHKKSSHIPPTNAPIGVIFEPSQVPVSPQKCSQEEIDKKKKAAQRKLLAKTNSTGSINFSQQDSHSTPEHRSPQKLYAVGVSPQKCSQEEINMKREEALKKRRLKQQQTLFRKS